MPSYWQGPAPTRCSVCRRILGECFVQGKARQSRHPNRQFECCAACHADRDAIDAALFVKQPDGRFLKTDMDKAPA